MYFHVNFIQPNTYKKNSNFCDFCEKLILWVILAIFTPKDQKKFSKIQECHFFSFMNFKKYQWTCSEIQPNRRTNGRRNDAKNIASIKIIEGPITSPI